ncbi:MAG: ABC transporter permease subunit [Thermomicrobium sp.]|nr:ABC transporter permease subunit [Thermomicrobium sp.]
MHWRRVLAIVRKDLTAVRRSRVLVLPLVLVPFIFFVVLPVALGILSRTLPLDARDSEDLSQLVRVLPTRERERIQALEPSQQLAILLFGYQFAPLLLIVPLATTTVIAADGIAGERERRTLEALLVTPIREDELFLGKLLAAAIPAVGISWGGATLSAALATLLVGVGPPLLPSVPWLLIAFVGSPAVALLGLGVIVLISSRVRGMQEVSQLSGLVALPIIGLLVAQSSGLVLLDWRLTLVACAVLWALAGIVLRVGRRSFQREALLRFG